MKAVVYTLGCKVNRTESESIMQNLKNQGYLVSDVFVPADLYIINTCAITADAEKKSRQAVAKAGKLNPHAKIVVTGCSSQNDYKKYVGLKNVSLITGTAGKMRLADRLFEGGASIEDLPRQFEESKTKAAHTRAFIKIQDGCDNFCAYCIVPYLRGRSRSRSIEKIVEDIESQVGVKEVTLTGINISKYGLDIKSSLSDLLKSLSHMDLRIRLGSLEIGVIDEEFLRILLEIKGFCPHFHLSVQSCEDGVLKSMNRHYKVVDIFAAVNQIRKYFPDASITADIIAGFPAESEDQHEKTKQNLAMLAFSDIHVFPYSKRKGTAAAKMTDLSFEVKKRRAQEIALLAKEGKKAFIAQNLGKRVEVLTEKGGTGLTKNYIRVYIQNDIIEANKLIFVKLTEPFKDGVKGEL